MNPEKLRAIAEISAMHDDTFVDVNHVAILLGCSPRHVWRLVEGTMPKPVALGRLRRWHLGTLRRWIRQTGIDS